MRTSLSLALGSYNIIYFYKNEPVWKEMDTWTLSSHYNNYRFITVLREGGRVWKNGENTSLQNSVLNVQ
jgi:hypothetical protein